MQIQIKKVEFKNLFSYGNKLQTFEPNGICFITGHNVNTDRRNFTGKSNLLKIFPLSLYGKVEGLNKSRVVNWKNRKNAETYITLQKGSNEYIIHRGIKPDILEVTKNGKELPQPPNKKDFQKYIEDEILEMDYTSFMQTVYADTNNSESILNMSKPNKRQFLENIFDLHYYTNLRDKANKKKTSIDNKINNLKTVISEKRQRINDAERLQKNYQDEIDSLPDSSIKLKEKEKYLEDNKEAYNKLKNDINTLNNEIALLKDQLHKIDTVKVKLKYKIKELNNNIVVIENIKEINVVENEVKEKEELLIEKQDHLTGKENEINQYLPDSELEEKKEHLIDNVATLKSEKNNINNQINDINDKIDNKIDSAKCPTCYQDVDHQLIKDHLNEELEKIKNKKEEIDEKLEQRENNLIDIKNVIKIKSKLQNEIDLLKDEIKQLQDNITELYEEIDEIKEKQKQIEKSKKYRKVIDKLKIKFKSYLSEIESINNDINNKESELEKNKQDKEKFETIENEIDKLKINIDNEKQQKDKLQKWIKESKKQQKQLEKEIESDNNDIIKLNNTQDYIEYIKDICSDDKARAYSISQKIPLLNQRTNFYLNKADVNYYIKLNNWLDVDIRGPGIKDCTYENLSGAERVSLDRSLQFSLNDINKLQSPTYYDLMILDEILDSSVDDIGLQNMINIITAKQQEDQSNILIVSHKNNFNELSEKIDNHYVIEYDGKYSYITRG